MDRLRELSAPERAEDAVEQCGHVRAASNSVISPGCAGAGCSHLAYHVAFGAAISGDALSGVREVAMIRTFEAAIAAQKLRQRTVPPPTSFTPPVELQVDAAPQIMWLGTARVAVEPHAKHQRSAFLRSLQGVRALKKNIPDWGSPSDPIVVGRARCSPCATARRTPLAYHSV